MPLLRRRKQEDVLEEEVDDLLDESEGGLLMSTVGQAAEQERPLGAEGGEPDGLAGMATEEAPADEVAEGEAAPGAASDGGPPAPLHMVSAEEPSSDDDPLAAFKDMTVHGGLGHLTDDMEDIEIADLVADLREVRGMLPATRATDDSSED